MRIDLHNFFKFYDPKNPKHVAAVEQLEVDLVSKSPDLMEDTSNWVKIFRTKVEPPKPLNNLLNVPYYPQTDNYVQPDRTCNSSACAMCLEFLKPGTLIGAKGGMHILKKLLRLATQLITRFKPKFLVLMELSLTLGIIFHLLILIVSCLLGDPLLLVYSIGDLYLLLLAGICL